jgi:hypothetical protein
MEIRTVKPAERNMSPEQIKYQVVLPPKIVLYNPPSTISFKILVHLSTLYPPNH